jgi:subtilase family serine protease
MSKTMMRTNILVLLIVAAVLCSAARVQNPFVHHPSRVPFVLDKHAEAIAPNSLITVNVGLKPSNVQKLFDTVRAVSSPSSTEYGSYLSVEQVATLVAPDASVVILGRFILPRWHTRDAVKSCYGDRQVDELYV